jgi:hypothetical protein
MGRLIPLKLQPSQMSLLHPPPFSLPPTGPLPPLPKKLPIRPTLKMPTSQIPRTQKEWRRVLDDVRALYLKRQYKQCSARCLQMLEEAADLVSS